MPVARGELFRAYVRHGEEEDIMRKIVAGLFVSLDGIIEAPETWSMPYMSDAEVGQTVGMLIAAGDTLLLGRKTYEGFRESFDGNSEHPMAAQLNAIPKVVVSTTLASADWQNSSLVRDNVAAAITNLKQQPGGTINMSGSGTLVSWLLEQGLLDELHLLVPPIVAGKGRRLFEGIGGHAPMTLTHCR